MAFALLTSLKVMSELEYWSSAICASIIPSTSFDIASSEWFFRLRDAVLNPGARLDDGAAHDNRRFHGSALLHHDAGEQDGVLDGAIHLAAFGDHRVDNAGVRADALAGTAGVAVSNLL